MWIRGSDVEAADRGFDGGESNAANVIVEYIL